MDYYSINSIRYFTDASEQESSYKEALKYPLLQLSNYIGDVSRQKSYRNHNFQYSYFPISAFVGLPDNWETTYSVNVMNFVSELDFSYSGVEPALSRIKWYSAHFAALEEPILTDSLETKIYRFTYLRTFDHPIVIGLENEKGIVTIYWKVSSGAGGYDSGNIIEAKTKTLTIKDWKEIEKRIKRMNFWNLSTVEKGLQGFDGSQWILEGLDLKNIILSIDGVGKR